MQCNSKWLQNAEFIVVFFVSEMFLAKVQMGGLPLNDYKGGRSFEEVKKYIINKFQAKLELKQVSIKCKHYYYYCYYYYFDER